MVASANRMKLMAALMMIVVALPVARAESARGPGHAVTPNASAEPCTGPVEGQLGSVGKAQSSPASSVVNLKAASELIERWLPCGQAKQFELKALDTAKDGQDRFEISGKHHHIVIAATSTSALLTGFAWYLKYVAHTSISLDGKQLNLPKNLPAPAETIRHRANVANRFALNDTDEGYTQPYADWSYWQRKIDILALHGINEVLVYPGQEKVYEQTFQDFGYSARYLRYWVPRAAHQPWWLLQNMCCFPKPISQDIINRRVALGRKIAERLRELGMTPVFPGYFGMVPPHFEDKSAGARTVPQGTWGGGFQRPDWLDPTNRWYAKVAADFYHKQTALFGDSTMYKMDPLHEGGRRDKVDLTAAAKSIQTALNKAHPGAIWVLLGWGKNPRPALIAGLDKSHALIVDGNSDTRSATNREADWNGTPYAFGTIWNFGGRTNIDASVSVWNKKYWWWRNKPSSALSGIAMMPEASNNNPAAVDFFTELAWRNGPVNLDLWFANWAWRRYGGAHPDPHAVAAWKVVEHTAYRFPWSAASRRATGLYELAPSLSAQAKFPYNTATFERALPQLLKVAPSLRNSSAYRYDLTAVTRQVLANQSLVLLPKIKAAYDAKDKAQFDKLSRRWLYLMKELDTVLATNKQFMLGPWLANAKSYATNPTESAQVEYDVRSLITIWGSRALNDYARREWQGLVGDYYYSRWKTYFDSLDQALSTGEHPRQIDWYAFGNNWAREQTAYPTQPSGNIHVIASQVLDGLTEGMHKVVKK